MGIKGLWKEVQPVCRPAHISQFRGQRVGVDAYCWLHRAVLASTVPLSTDRPDDKFIALFVSRVELLQRYGVTPVVIFDGASMPMKAATDESRHQRREAARQDGLRLLQQGHAEEAYKQLGKAIDVTTEIAYAVLLALKDRDVECIVAPYEADAQLAHLCREGYVQAVISEDSDLMVYKCAVLLAKMDGGGNCDAIHIRDIPKVAGFASQQSHEAFVTVCILAGCDYVASLPSIGIKTAQRLVAASRSIPELLGALQTQHGFTARELGPYEEALHKALYCFTHHLVYCPNARRVIPFHPLPPNVPIQSHLIGDIWDAALSQAVCEHHTHDPSTHLPYLGRHKDSLQLYMRVTKRGQRSLNEFSAFERYKANRIVMRQEGQGAEGGGADGSGSGGGSGWIGGMGAAAASAAPISTTAGGYAQPAAKAAASTPIPFAGFDHAAATAAANNGPPVVLLAKSKYFGAGARSVQQQLSSSSLDGDGGHGASAQRYGYDSGHRHQLPSSVSMPLAAGHPSVRPSVASPSSESAPIAGTHPLRMGEVRESTDGKPFCLRDLVTDAAGARRNAARGFLAALEASDDEDEGYTNCNNKPFTPSPPHSAASPTSATAAAAPSAAATAADLSGRGDTAANPLSPPLGEMGAAVASGELLGLCSSDESLSDDVEAALVCPPPSASHAEDAPQSVVPPPPSASSPLSPPLSSVGRLGGVAACVSLTNARFGSGGGGGALLSSSHSSSAAAAAVGGGAAYPQRVFSPPPPLAPEAAPQTQPSLPLRAASHSNSLNSVAEVEGGSYPSGDKIASPASMASNGESAHVVSRCPHRNPHCSIAHSIFFRCFKATAVAGAVPSASAPQPSRSSNSGAGEAEKETSASVSERAEAEPTARGVVVSCASMHSTVASNDTSSLLREGLSAVRSGDNSGAVDAEAATGAGEQAQSIMAVASPQQQQQQQPHTTTATAVCSMSSMAAPKYTRRLVVPTTVAAGGGGGGAMSAAAGGGNGGGFSALVTATADDPTPVRGGGGGAQMLSLAHVTAAGEKRPREPSPSDKGDDVRASEAEEEGMVHARGAREERLTDVYSSDDDEEDGGDAIARNAAEEAAPTSTRAAAAAGAISNSSSNGNAACGIVHALATQWRSQQLRRPPLASVSTPHAAAGAEGAAGASQQRALGGVAAALQQIRRSGVGSSPNVPTAPEGHAAGGGGKGGLVCVLSSSDDETSRSRGVAPREGRAFSANSTTRASVTPSSASAVSLSLTAGVSGANGTNGTSGARGDGRSGVSNSTRRALDLISSLGMGASAVRRVGPCIGGESTSAAPVGGSVAAPRAAGAVGSASAIVDLIAGVAAARAAKQTHASASDSAASTAPAVTAPPAPSASVSAASPTTVTVAARQSVEDMLSRLAFKRR